MPVVTLAGALRLAAAVQLLLLVVLLLRDQRRSRVAPASALFVGCVVCYLVLPLLVRQSVPDAVQHVARFYLLIVFGLPVHPLTLALFLLYMIVRNVVGHLGFEIWPAWFARHPLTRWHLTPTHHDLHHRWGRGNYGLYFSFWDDWLGTTRPEYAGAFEAVTLRSRELRGAARG